MLSEPLIAPALPSQGAVPTGEVVTTSYGKTSYGKTSNAGSFPNERREVFLDVTPRWTCEAIYQFVKPITPGMNCTRIRPDGRSMRHWVMSSSESSPEISLASAATRPIPP
ncbi:hypothetical protein [Micromonospora sp. CPCC 206061]|uniref:hypothetical protein n=1 Tax=Micromonospora sp. CPCC 206061 TaxID=3122410 RepID=UPI002FF0CD85